MTDRFFPPPDLFAAVAIGAPPEGDPSVPADLDLPPGVHLRVLPSPALGFPLAPFGIFRVHPFPVDLEDVLWRDREGNVVGPDLASAGGVLFADTAPPPNDEFDIALEVVTDGLDGTATLLDRVGDRVLAVRSQPPFILGGPRPDRVRIEGRATELGLRAWRVNAGVVLEELLNGDPLDPLGLPIEGDRPPWYTGGQGREAARLRVENGAPLRLGPPDEPDGPFSRATPENEVARVLAHEDALFDACDAMLADPATLPSARRARLTQAAHTDEHGHHPEQFAEVHLAGSLLVQAMDPGVGRYLGLVGRLDERPDWEHLVAYAAIGLFAVDAQATLPDGRLLVDALGTFHPLVESVCDRYAALVGAQDALRLLADRWGPERLVLRGLIALAAAVPPPDLPRVPQPKVGRSRWLPGGEEPSSTWRQELLVPPSPLGSLLALALLEDGEWKSRHEKTVLPPPADPPERANPLLLGRTRERPPLAATGLVSDANPLTSGSENRYRVALADLFGRFGPPEELAVPEPARPGPPAPALRADVALDGPDGAAGPPASPGTVMVRVPVPSVRERAAGSLHVDTLELSFDGVPLPPRGVPRSAGGTIEILEVPIPLPALGVGERRRSRVSAAFVDTAGARSPSTEVSVGYTDRRRPPVLKTAIGIVWTSRPGPSQEVELKLRWRGSAGMTYRVYVADAKSLGLAAGSRAAVAADGGHRDLAHTLGGRDRFRLLTDPPLKAVGDWVTLDERLPRALTTVQFLRVVPATEGGREAEFDACPVVAVAVPSDRRPPPPRVSAEVAAPGGRAKITILASGLDLVELRAREPGLFTEPPGPAARPPRFRLRRAAGPVAAPLYAREIARGDLQVHGAAADAVFQGELDDPHELAPFVRYSYWAEVQMPPERRVEAGSTETSASDVLPVEPGQIADLPGLFSAASAPATVLAAPADAPPPLEGATASVMAEAGQVRAVLAAPATPGVHELAVAPYRLRIWEQWGGGEITAAGPDVDVHGAALAWQGTPRPSADAPLPLVLHVAVVDPLGRQGTLAAVTGA